MDRRNFLKLLGLGAIFAATPKIIFDMGKNSRIYKMADLPSMEDRLIVSFNRKSFPEMKSFNVCGVQPMHQPIGLIYAMKTERLSEKYLFQC